MTRKRAKTEERQFLDINTADSIAGDLPDGAYWAMMEELTGEEPGAIADIIERGEANQPRQSTTTLRCRHCKRTFNDPNAVKQHMRAKHPGDRT